MTFLISETAALSEANSWGDLRGDSRLSPAGGKLFKFGEFILNPAIRHLFRRGEPARLPPHAFDILLFLVRKRGTVVSKEELLEKIWPGTFVEETNLAVHVSTIRRVLGEKRGENKFIETISGRGYCFVAPVHLVGATRHTTPGGDSGPAGSRAAAGQIRSLAVVPFTNESDTSSVRYLSEGITESLISSLARLGGLKVFARSAVSQYQNHELNLREIGVLLGADAVLTGRILLIEEQLEIGVELVSVFDQSHVWGMQYRCHLNDIFHVKSEITSAVTENLRPALSGADAAPRAPARDEGSEAYGLSRKGRYLLSKRTREGFLKGLEFFRRALAKDPDYAPAHSGTADAHLLLCIHSHARAAESIPEARAAAGRALALDETLSEAHASHGHIQFRHGRQWEEAESSFARALSLDPRNAVALRWYSELLTCLGRFEEALSCQHRALELDPFSLHANTELAARFNHMGRFATAAKRLEEVLEIEPDFVPALVQLSVSYAKLGLHESALECVGRADGLSANRGVKIFKAWVHASAGNRAEALETLRAVPGSPGGEAADGFELAAVHAALGDRQKAFAYLEQAIGAGSLSVCALCTDPRLEALRGEPGFGRLLERVGLNATR